MTRAPTDRSHLSIGEVLSLLQDEFPDITISKIRFLESQGLLDPERTPSGYRKFYESDIDRLRWILRQQKDNYLPLKVIKDRLDGTGPIRTSPTAAGHGAPEPSRSQPPAVPPEDAGGQPTPRPPRRNGSSAVALDDRPGPAGIPARPVHRPPPAPRVPAAPSPAPRPSAGAMSRPDVAEVIEGPVRRGGADLGRRPEPAPVAAESRSHADDDGRVSLTVDELAQASGLSARAVRELEGYGLLEPHVVGDTAYYDADALLVARTAAGFLEHGIEARHIRSYKVATEREAALYEQIVLPLLKQRNPDARRRAEGTVAELVRLGDQMRSVLLRRGLREHLPPP
ncbi:MAG TPA: MerR family transcriptional regulator [Acidimicrobiales bacterium]|nr:MerR family transcriptional regulator [Acidimicrobiales bacterium]